MTRTLQIIIPHELDDMSMDINLFVHNMVQKLTARNYKADSWRSISTTKLTELLMSELAEMIEARVKFKESLTDTRSSHRVDASDLVNECADIANFAMFISAVTRKEANTENNTRNVVIMGR